MVVVAGVVVADVVAVAGVLDMLVAVVVGALSNSDNNQ